MFDRVWHIHIDNCDLHIYISKKRDLLSALWASGQLEGEKRGETAMDKLISKLVEKNRVQMAKTAKEQLLVQETRQQQNLKLQLQLLQSLHQESDLLAYPRQKMRQKKNSISF